ncbi:glycosyltransferase family protein [Nonlabens antarcticus]|uniref:UDP-glycosyltransferase n=1 Tax=Nonlabens antarcticus TaxID=392714 RepID=UPI001891E624|nr:UDP-glycosyltransferase [Nonlabens antarcticus]
MPQLKILIIADTLDEQASSGGKASMALVKGFVEQGYKIKVYHYSRKELEIEGIQLISICEKRSTLSYIKAKSQLLFQRWTGKNINSWIECRKGFSYTHDYDVESIKYAVNQESPENYDYILTLSYASSFRAHKAILQIPHWHKKLLSYVHDPYPMHSYPRPYDWVEPGHQFKRDFFIDLFEKSAHILYPSKLLAAWMESYYPTGKGKSVVLPHLMIDGLKNTGDYPQYYHPDNFNLLHAGSLMSARNPMGVVEAFTLFLKENPTALQEANLVIVGGASVFHTELEGIANELPQLTLSPGKEDFQRTYNMQQQAAVNIVLEAKGPTSPFLPGKVSHCIAADKPILLLGPYYSETRRLLGNDYLYWAEIDDVEKIKNYILCLYNDWKKDRTTAVLNRPDLMEYFSSRSICKVFEHIKSEQIND